jgi:hypothetical protein
MQDDFTHQGQGDSPVATALLCWFLVLPNDE